MATPLCFFLGDVGVAETILFEDKYSEKMPTALISDLFWEEFTAEVYTSGI